MQWLTPHTPHVKGRRALDVASIAGRLSSSPGSSGVGHATMSRPAGRNTKNAVAFNA